MKTENPADPKKPRAAGDTYSAAKPRRQSRPRGARAENKCGVSSKNQKSVKASTLTTVAKFDGKSKVMTRVTECIDYKGYTLKIESHRTGWKVAIFPKGSPFALHLIPYTTEVSKRDVVVEQAKAIVDEVAAVKTLRKVAIEPAKSSKSRNLTHVAPFLRFRRSLLQWGAILKRAYFSVNQPPRASS